jgi:hypothetical protein
MMLFKCHFPLAVTFTSTLLLLTGPALAHCDSIDGPVVADANRALAAKSVDPVLKWVSEKDTKAVQQAFQMTLEVRNESEKAKAVADRYFFETLVRLHRASEGEGFTGLKPAGSVEPGIAAADRALETGKIEPLAGKLAEAVRVAAVQRFQAAHTAKRSAEDSVKQGRAFVAAYVQFTHFVEQVDHLAAKGASHQHRETLERH